VQVKQENRQPGDETVVVVPPAEVEFLTRALVEVLDLAEAGQASDGYQYLLSGLHRAETARDKGEPWGSELVEQWRLALADYAETYGVVPGDSDGARPEVKDRGPT
jgi:hypothetical protein